MMIIKIMFFILLTLYLYNIAITFFAWRVKPEKYNKSIEHKTHFGILIPCHNEGEVIYDTLKAIERSDYSRSKYTVNVILDNCTDNTESECIRFINNSSVNVRLIKVKGGSKPKAISLAVKYLKENNLWNTINSILMVDSDNKISSTLMSTYNFYHLEGLKILQCRILSDNDDTIISKGFTSSFNSMGVGYQYARNEIGLSATLSGTGFSVNREVWDEIGFDNCTTLTEDLEFAIMCILEGYYIKYIHSEYVLNQNLDELKPSINQRIRWCRGHMQTSVKLLKKVIRKFIKKPSLQLIDSLIILTVPSKSLLYLIFNISCLFVAGKNIIYIPYTIVTILVGYNIIFAMHCNGFKIKYLIPHLFYAICMFYILAYGTITYRKTNWVKTVHKKIKKKEGI